MKKLLMRVMFGSKWRMVRRKLDGSLEVCANAPTPQEEQFRFLAEVLNKPSAEPERSG